MRKLWNRPNLPVWSLVTRDAAGSANMNICTYVTSVSMSPKLMLVAVYCGTKTLQNLHVNPRQPVLLQLLSEDLAPVVRVCGQQSGAQIDKIARLKKRYMLAEHEGLPYFTDAAGIMQLTFTTLTPCGGDHELLVGEVTWSKNLDDVPILTTDFLKQHRYTR
jgi:flavin reductase (DIM6/NTAB) family NADH-FMN oxidoreductase RutF